MEAIRRADLRVISGGGDDAAVHESDEEREQRIISRVGAALREAVRELPPTSSWRLPFVKAWRAIRDDLRRRRRNG
jgi:hypothetical protein